MIRRILKYILLISGSLFLILMILCLTTAPFWMWYRLSTKHAGIHHPPEYIVVLGGGGMPSESGLMRTWYAALVGNHFKRSKIIIALPGDTADSLSSVCQMKKELIVRGIAGSRISFESSGTNTRAQAMNTKKIITIYELRFMNKIPNQPDTAIQDNGIATPSRIPHPASRILIITSPEHLYRAVRAFRKAGFIRIDGVPAFETAIESELSFNDRLLGGKKWLPPIGDNLTVRYEFWTQMHYEQLVFREWMAIAYYKLNGWI